MPRVKVLSGEYAKQDFVKAISKAGIDAGCKSTAAISRRAKVNRNLLYRRIESPKDMTLEEVARLHQSIGLPLDAVNEFITKI